MAVTKFQFPPAGEFYADEIPIWLKFKAAKYSTFSKNRTLNYVKSNPYLEIILPFPKAMATENKQNYSVGGSLTTRAIEIGGIAGVIDSFKQEITAKAELAKSFLSGGGVIRADHLETVLQPGARRTHSFVIDLIAKTSDQAEVASNIALAFQTNVYPIASTSSILTMEHPPLWSIEAFSTYSDIYKPEWDGNALVSVLGYVDINRSPILNTPFITPDFKPLAINIKLNFIELEPAMQLGTGEARIFSRSDRNANF